MRLTTGTLLAADTSARTLTYRLVPYGEIGRTNIGPVSFPAGVLAAGGFPDRCPFTLEHDPTRPLGWVTATVDSPDELRATVTLLPTTAGDDLLAEAAAGLRTGASIECADVTVRDGVVMTARMVGASAVVSPAFPSATLAASEHDEPEQTDPEPEPEQTDPETSDVDPAPANSEDEPVTEPTEDTATVPAVPVLTASATPRPLSPTDAAERVANLMRAAARGEHVDLTAALSDVTGTGMDSAIGPQWLGQVWEADPRPRPFVDSLLSGPLTSLDGPKGWRWNAAPVTADYDGDKAAVPSAAVTVSAVTAAIKRIAGAHDMDRAIFDLGHTELIEAYWREMANAYADDSEDYASDTIVAAATDGLSGSGIVAGSTAAAVIVSAALQVATVGRPSFVAVGSTLFGEYLSTAQNSGLEYLTGSAGFDGQGGLGGIRLFLGKSLGAKQVVAGDGRGARFYELPGSPIRAQAVNMPNGGIDVGVFGYCSVLVGKPTAFVKITRPDA